MTRTPRKLRIDDVDLAKQEPLADAPRRNGRTNGTPIEVRYRPVVVQDDLEDLWDNVPV